MSGEGSTLEQSDQFQFQKSFSFPDSFEQEQKNLAMLFWNFFTALTQKMFRPTER